MFAKIVLLLSCVVYLASANVGELCVKTSSNAAGVCVNIKNCPSAIEDLRNRRPPQICSFDGTDPIVCCPEAAKPSIDNRQPPATTRRPSPTTNRVPVATTTKRSSTTTTTTEEVPVYDYVNNDGSSVETCEPLSPLLTSPKTGQKAWDMCLEYQQKLVFPCNRAVVLASGAVNRVNNCFHNADELIIGGENAAENEFTHMVLLGFGQTLATVDWQCGGSLISDKFVLTAGHCTVSRDGGPVTYARMGALNRSDKMNPALTRRVSRYISYPQYNPPNRYHDIALVELERTVTLSQFLVPACLHVASNVVNDLRASATGWGLTEYKGGTADRLQKVILSKFPLEECEEKFPENRLMKHGFDEPTQVCYGDYTKSKDTCQGDSGGPLQIKSKNITCMYMIVGVTSFGKACGFIGDPGIYTRVSNYVPWIESIVWP